MNYLRKFRKNHNIDKSANLSNIKVAVASVSEAYQIAWDHIAYIDNKTEKDGFVVHTHLNLIVRVFEQAEGMLACIANNCFPSSEALGRVVTEGSINLMYISVIGDEKAIVAFFTSWIEGHKRKLGEWKSNIQGKSHAQELCIKIDIRLSMVKEFENYVDLVVNNLTLKKEELKSYWPKSLYRRFEALQLEDIYYTSYHRLSGASHITAEDTISWMISLQKSDDFKKCLSKTARAYSIMMSRISCIVFVKAVGACCMAHGLKDQSIIDRLDKITNNLAESASKISKEAGVPV